MKGYNITSEYLQRLRDKGYQRYRKLFGLYAGWKDDPDIKAFKKYFKFLRDEKEIISPKFLSEVGFNVLRGKSFEEFCTIILKKVIKETGMEKGIELVRSAKVMTEEFLIFVDGEFKSQPKYKSVDIALGRTRQGDNSVNPWVIISCKAWQSANWLDEDRAVFDNVKNKYPDVLGYSLCMKVTARPVALISSQRTGLKVFNLSEENEVRTFRKDIKDALLRIKSSI